MTGTGISATTATLTPTLSAADRCDRCGAQAKVRAVLAAGDLVFCSHHAKAYAPTLRHMAVDWVDESELLTD